MSKKTNAEKHARRHHRKPRRNKRPNPAYGMKLFSDASLIRSVETIAFGEIGCALLRALRVKPIDLLTTPPRDDDEAESETIQ